MSYKVIVLEDDNAVLADIVSMLRQTPGFELMAYYQDTASALRRSKVFSPNLILVSVDEGALMDTIPSFKEMFPEADVLGLMEHWNPDFADQALSLGASGCLLKDFRPGDIKEALRVFGRRGEAKPARIITFFSPKGHSGRSTLLSTLAMALARQSRETVAIIDADLQSGDLPMLFDVEPSHTVVEATRDIKLLSPITFANYYHELAERLWLLGSPRRPEYAELVDVDGLMDVVRMTGNLFRYVLVDLPAGFSPLSISTCELADTTIITSMLNTGFEAQHMKRAMGMFDMWVEYGKKVYPMFGGLESCEPHAKKALEQECGHELTEIFPYENEVDAVVSCGRVDRVMNDNNLYTRKVNRLAESIIKGSR